MSTVYTKRTSLHLPWEKNPRGVRFDPVKLRAIEACAGRDGLSVSVWVLRQAMRVAAPELDAATVDAASMGLVLRQAAQRAHMPIGPWLREVASAAALAQKDHPSSVLAAHLALAAKR